jgi:hypothetical protein
MRAYGQTEPSMILRLDAEKVEVTSTPTSLGRQLTRALLGPQETVHGC